MPTFLSLTKDTCVEGLALLKGGTPHYDVLASDGTPLAAALARSFCLGKKSAGDVTALKRYKDEVASQVVMTTAEIEALFPGENLKGQDKMFEVRMYDTLTHA